MGQTYLIDTNVISDFLRSSFDEKGMSFLKEIINNSPSISFISKIELMSWKTTIEIEKIIEDFISICNVVSISDEIILNTITIRRKKSIKTPDAIIAATAQSLGYIIITNNTKDFQNIKGLKFINPYTL